MPKNGLRLNMQKILDIWFYAFYRYQKYLEINKLLELKKNELSVNENTMH